MDSWKVSLKWFNSVRSLPRHNTRDFRLSKILWQKIFMCRTVIYVVVSLFNYLFAASIHELGAQELISGPKSTTASEFCLQTCSVLCIFTYVQKRRWKTLVVCIETAYIWRCGGFENGVLSHVRNLSDFRLSIVNWENATIKPTPSFAFFLPSGLHTTWNDLGNQISYANSARVGLRARLRWLNTVF